MPETIIRPTLKFIKAGYVMALLGVIVLGVATLYSGWPSWLLVLSPLFLIWPVKGHVENRMTQVTILGDKLRFETGFASKTTRTLLLSRIQDITVHQSAIQRLLGVGDISIETAGETSRLTVPSIDRPQEVADRLNELSRS